MDFELYEKIVAEAAALVLSLRGVDDVRTYNNPLIVRIWSVRPRPGEYRGRPCRSDELFQIYTCDREH